MLTYFNNKHLLLYNYFSLYLNFQFKKIQRPFAESFVGQLNYTATFHANSLSIVGFSILDD